LVGPKNATGIVFNKTMRSLFSIAASGMKKNKNAPKIME
jgi:hypothetical protein